MIFFEPHQRDKSVFPHDPFKALVVPRPIGWIATMSARGELNLAPYSYFNAFSSSPPIVGFSSEGEKDSSTFAMESGEFVWSMATWDLRDPMNASAASLPRVAASPAAATTSTALWSGCSRCPVRRSSGCALPRWPGAPPCGTA